MDTLQIQNNICQTIDIIVQNAIQNAGFDRTIQAVVSECTDESIGQYKVRYQDSTFYAYAPNPEDKYSVGAGVYILVQNNDMKKDKFIVGTVDKLGKDYLTVTDESERYEMIGANCLKDIQEIQLCSYDKPGSYKVAEKSSDKINNNDLLAYCKEADYLAIKMNVRTSLEREQRMRGNYGLKFTLLFNNKENPNQDKEETYVINIDSMIGDPYNFINPTPQFFALEFNMENFKGIKEISAFCEKFPKQKDNMPNDIFITELEVYAANQMSEEELMSPHLRFFTPRGTIFKEDLPVTAYGRIDGEDINKGEFYWFIEDNMIDSESPEFLPIGGKGWKCINFFDTIKDEEGNEYIEFRPFETGYQLFELKKHLSAQTTYKCVMRYNENILSKEITLYNMSSNYSISIESSSGGDKFYNDIGETTLTCKVVDKENKPISNCIYKWISINNNNYMSKLQNNTSEVKVLATSIDYFTTYQCMVYINVDGTEVLIGSSKITLTNSEEAEGTYHLVINNGSQSFIYNEEGISPANKNLENPISILPLEFILYDNQGQKIPHEKIAVENVEWQVPAENSLIQLGSNSVEIYGYYFENVYSLQFGIKSTYSVNATNNQIALTVKYQDMVLKAFTNLIFTKEGDLGSNGTGIITRIEAIEKENSDLLQKEEPMMYYNKSNRSYSKNYSKLQAIVVEGEQKPTVYAESDNNSNCIWSILQNRISPSTLDATHIKYTLGTGFSQLSTSENVSKIANVISAKIKYNNLQFFTAFPMITAFISNNIYIPYLKKNTGFRSVKYSSDGLYPKYSNAVPFTIGIKNNQGEDVNVSSFRFKWGTNAIKTGENTFKYRPQDQYDGRAVNESLICIIYNSSGTQIAKIFIPIYMYLNTYGYSALNDWNGNSIEIDEKGGYILTPQVGAGEKNASNQFTGLLMGKMVDSNKSEKVGLIGLYNGTQTIFLDSKTGRSEFGKAGNGQIILDPSKNEAIIQSGNFDTTAKTGMQINLSSPSIIFGSGNFSVDSTGKLEATGVNLTGIITAEEGFLGGWSISKGGITYDSTNYTVHVLTGTNNSKDFLVVHDKATNTWPFFVRADGHMNAAMGTIGGITLNSNYGLYTNNKTTANSTNNGFLIQKDGNIYLGKYNSTIGKCPFQVTNTGALYSYKGNFEESTINLANITTANITTANIIESNLIDRLYMQISDYSDSKFQIIGRGKWNNDTYDPNLNKYTPTGEIYLGILQGPDQYGFYGGGYPQLKFTYLIHTWAGGHVGYASEISLSTVDESQKRPFSGGSIRLTSGQYIEEGWFTEMHLDEQYIYLEGMDGIELRVNAGFDYGAATEKEINAYEKYMEETLEWEAAFAIAATTEKPYAEVRSRVIYETTTDKEPNVYIATGGSDNANGKRGMFHRHKSSSSKRYKHNIKDLNLNDIYGLYTVPVRTFKYNLDYLSKDSERYNKDMPGFIAEEIEEVNPILVDHLEDTGEAEMWNTKIMIPCLLKLIQNNHEEINDLKQQVKQLQAKLDNI